MIGQNIDPDLLPSIKKSYSNLGFNKLMLEPPKIKVVTMK